MISHLSNIQTLCLSFTSVTDNGLPHLLQLTNLETLLLTNCKISDIGLQTISSLSNLKTLSISYCNLITEYGLSCISKMPNLKKISFQGTLSTNKQIPSIGTAAVTANNHNGMDPSAADVKDVLSVQ